MLMCNYCRHFNEEKASFCGSCGSALIRIWNGSDFNTVSFLAKEHLRYLFLSPQGRINRQRIWLGTLLTYPLYMAAFVLFVILLTTDHYSGILGTVGISLTLAVMLGTITGSIMMGIKRAHDRNCSGWYVVLTMLPWIGFYFQIKLYFSRGTSGTNRYGNDPTRSR